MSAEAEVARRSRVMAGLEGVEGDQAEAAIVEALRGLRRSGDRSDAQADRPSDERP